MAQNHSRLVTETLIFNRFSLTVTYYELLTLLINDGFVSRLSPFWQILQNLSERLSCLILYRNLRGRLEILATPRTSKWVASFLYIDIQAQLYIVYPWSEINDGPSKDNLCPFAFFPTKWRLPNTGNHLVANGKAA